MASMTTTREAVKTQTRIIRWEARIECEDGDRGFIRIKTDRTDDVYHIEPIASDYGAAFRLDKHSGPEVAESYDVCLDGPTSTCECKGFLRWRHCKHLEGLNALRRSGKLTCRTPDRRPAFDDGFEYDDLT